MVEKLRETLFELDEVVAAINSRVESLKDVEIALGQLRDNMDEAVFHGKEQLFYREHHRTVRILADLMYYLMKDLVNANDKVCQLNQSMFEMVMGAKSYTQRNTLNEGGGSGQ